MGETIALTNLSWVSHWQDDNVTAAAYARRALEIARDINAGTPMLNALANLGHAL